MRFFEAKSLPGVDATPGLKAIALRAMKLELLIRIYSSGEGVIWHRLPVLSLELGLSCIYPFLFRLRLEESMPSFESSARQEFRNCFARNQPTATVACFLAEHQKNLLLVSEEISEHLDALGAKMTLASHQASIGWVKEHFLAGTLTKVLPSLFQEMSHALHEDLRNIFASIVQNFKGPDGIFQDVLNFVRDNKADEDASDQEELILLRLISVSVVGDFFWYYTKKIEDCLVEQSILWPGKMTPFFSDLGQKAKQINRFLKSGMTLQKARDHVIAAAECEHEVYQNGAWRHFEKQELKSSRKSLLECIADLDFLRNLLEQENPENKDLERVSELSQELRFIISVLNMRKSILNFRGLRLKSGLDYDQSFTIESMRTYFIGLKPFLEIQKESRDLLSVRVKEIKQQDFCRDLLMNISDDIENIEKRLAEDTNQMYRVFIDQKNSELDVWACQKEPLEANYLDRQAMAFLIEAAGRFYRSSIQGVFLFWMNEDVNVALSALEARAKKDMRGLAEKIKSDILFKLEKIACMLGKTGAERLSELREVEKITLFLQSLMRGLMPDRFLPEGEEWWVGECRRALKRLETVLDEEICGRLAAQEPLENLVMNLFSPKTHQAPKFDFDAEIELVSLLLKIAREQSFFGGRYPQIEFEYWEDFRLKLKTLKCHYESLAKLPKLDGQVDWTPLCVFLKDRASLLRLLRTSCEALDKAVDLLFIGKIEEWDLDEVTKMRDKLKALAELKLKEELPGEFDQLPEEHQHFFKTLYFSMQKGYLEKYGDKIHELSDFISDQLESRERFLGATQVFRRV